LSRVRKIVKRKKKGKGRGKQHLHHFLHPPTEKGTPLKNPHSFQSDFFFFVKKKEEEKGKRGKKPIRITYFSRVFNQNSAELEERERRTTTYQNTNHRASDK